MKLKLVRLLPGLVLVPLILAGIFLMLDRNASYRSPLYAHDSGWNPRAEALTKLEEVRERKAEEARQRAELLKNLNTEKMVELGKEIVLNKGFCLTCHRIGAVGHGQQGPDLEGVGARAATRVPGMTDVEYLAESLYQPRAYIVEGFPPAMPAMNGPPASLDDLEILMVIAYLQSLGGTPTVTPETELPNARP